MIKNSNPSKDIIFGTRPVLEAMRSGEQIDKILVQRGVRGDQMNELLTQAKKLEIQVQMVPLEKLNRITRKNHQGVIGFISPVPFQDITNILPGLFEDGLNPFILVLDRVTDVRNFGAIIRTAECAGVHAVILPEKESARIGGDAVKTSAGALFKMPVCRVKSLKQTITLLKEYGLQVVAATEKAAENYYETDFTVPLAVVLGSEEKGVSMEALKLSDKLVKIPVLGEIGSLNVSVAAGVLLFEAVKQRIVHQ